MKDIRDEARKQRVFHWLNPTPGTGIAQAIETAFDATKGVLSVLNPSTATGDLQLDELLLIPTVIPAASTRSEWLLAVDAITRYSAGGAAITGVNPNLSGALTAAAQATVHFGALTLAAESAGVRRTLRGQLSEVVVTAFKEYRIRFDDAEAGRGPVILRPTQAATFHLWHPSNAVTAASWEFVLRARVIDPPNR
jgi:hypothetical protein